MDEIITHSQEHYLNAKEEYIVVIASCLAKKLDPKKEPILANLIQQYPYANVYDDEKKGRPKPGSYTIYGDGLKRRKIIVVFSQIYASKMDYPRDNKRKRLEWFADALNEIAEIPKLQSLAFPEQIARDGGGNWSDYYLAISDFASTMALRAKIPITIYSNPHADGPTTQISLNHCLNLDTSITLSKLAFVKNHEKIHVDRDELNLRPKKSTNRKLNFKGIKNGNKSLKMHDSDDENKDKKIKFKISRSNSRSTDSNQEAIKEPIVDNQEDKNDVNKKEDNENDNQDNENHNDNKVDNNHNKEDDQRQPGNELEEVNPDLVVTPFPKTELNKDWIDQDLTHPPVDASWKQVFEKEEIVEKLVNTQEILVTELEKWGETKRFLPIYDNIFKSFQLCTWDKLKVVILGQDPYPNADHAMGLSFSVPDGIAVPKSLNNIFKELKDEYGDEYQIPKHGNLQFWAEQGVLLLNSALTIRGRDRNSHQSYWKDVTNLIIKSISEMKDTPVVFILWGRDARNKAILINHRRHLILESNHPSPLSAYRGFFGCNHFKTCNKKLESCGLEPINWQT